MVKPTIVPKFSKLMEEKSNTDAFLDAIDNDKEIELLKGNDIDPRIKYSNDQIKMLLSRVAENGTNLKEECLEAGFKYNSIFVRIQRSEELSEMEHRARLASLDLRVRLLNDVVMNEPDVNRARLLCDNIKWEAQRVYRKVYGDKVSLEIKTTPMGDKSDEELQEMARQLLASTVVKG